jgi:hypothetical protein
MMRAWGVDLVAGGAVVGAAVGVASAGGTCGEDASAAVLVGSAGEIVAEGEMTGGDSNGAATVAAVAVGNNVVAGAVT